MTEDFLARLRILIQRTGLTQAEFAKKVPVSPSFLTEVLKGRSQMSERVIKQISLSHSVNERWLLTGEGEIFIVSPEVIAVLDRRGEQLHDEMMKSLKEHLPAAALATRAIPVLGKVPAGFPNECREEIIEYISLPNIPAGAYALIIHGESMSPTIRNGDYVIFLPGADAVKSGDVVIVNNEWGESMCKRYREKDDEQLLVSDNAEYQAVKPNSHFEILGKVIKVWRDIRF